MRQSIFDIENRLNISEEFMKFVETFEEKNIYYRYNSFSYFAFVDKYVFNLWKDRDTFIDLTSYFEHIGIDENILDGNIDIPEEKFLNFIEFILNIQNVIIKNFISLPTTDVKLKNIISHNIPIILEKMNYEAYKNNDRIYLRKRDADTDSILEVVEEDISDLLLSYNDIRNNNLEAKRSILKKIDLYIEKDKKIYKSYDTKLYDSIGTIVNKMGVNHPINESPFKEMPNDEILMWYDKCFKMMIHLIRWKEINKIKSEREELVK